jgi:hypothetical protein
MSDDISVKFQGIYETIAQELQIHPEHVVFEYGAGILNISTLDWQTADQFLKDTSIQISSAERKRIFNKVKDGKNICIFVNAGEPETRIFNTKQFIEKQTGVAQ